MSKFNNYLAFVAVAETGSVVEAASRLNYSVPAVSKQLSQLELDLQVQLFHRSHKKLEITDAGKLFYPKCKSILSSVSYAEDEVLAEHDAVKGTISITLSKALCRSLVFEAISLFIDKYPQINFNIRFSDHLEDLHDENIDFAFRLGKLEDNSHMIAMPIMDTQLVACATPNYLNKNGKPKSLSDLGDTKLILMSPLNASEQLRAFLNKEKVSLRNSTAHICNDIEGVYQSVKVGLGIGMMLNISVQKEINEGTFISVFPKKNFPRKRLYLLSKKSQWQSQKQRMFKSHIKETLCLF